MPRQPKKPAAEWEAQKAHIHRYYITENCSLKVTMERMKLEHSFDASEKEYTNRFKSWRMSKNMKKEDWKFVHDVGSTVNEIQAFFSEKRMNSRRCKKALARYKPEFENSLRELLSNLPFNDANVAEASSLSRTSRRVSTMTIPWLMFQNDHGHLLYSIVEQIITSLSWVNPFGCPLVGYSSGGLCMQSAQSLLGTILHIEVDHIDVNFMTRSLDYLNKMLPENPAVDQNPVSKDPFYLLIQSCIYLSSNGYLHLGEMDRFLSWILESGSAQLFMQSLQLSKKTNLSTIDVFLSRLLVSAASLEKVDVVLALLRAHVHVNSGIPYSYDESARYLFHYVNTLTPEGPLITWDIINPLQIAVLRGNTHICQLLLKHGAKTNLISLGFPIPPLELAISINRGNLSICEMLIASGAIMHASSLSIVEWLDYSHHRQYSFYQRPETLLIKAVKMQNIPIIEFLLRKGAPVNQPILLSGTPLQIAIMNNDMEMVMLLLQAGAEVNAVDSNKHSAIAFFTLAIKRAGSKLIQSEQVAPEVITAQPTNDESDEDWIFCDLRSAFENLVNWEAYMSPLHIATRRNNFGIAQHLLQYEADVNEHIDWKGLWEDIEVPTHKSLIQLYEHMKISSMEKFQTPLHESVMNGNSEMTRLLLQHGADPNCANSLGETPSQLACSLERVDGKTEDEVLQLRVHLMEVLFEFGADMNSSTNPMHSTSCLEAAVATGDANLVELLLRSGAKSTTPSSDQKILQAAAATGEMGMIDLLSSAGFSPNPDIFWISLHVAASKGDLPAAQQLLARGVDVNIMHIPECITGSVLQSAINGGNIAIVQMLLDAGAHVNDIIDGETALCSAVWSENRDILELLLSQGADPSPPHAIVTPLCIAAAKGLWNMTQRLLLATAKVDQLSQSPKDYTFPGFSNPSCQARPSVPTTPLFWVVSRWRYICHTMVLNEYVQEDCLKELESLETITSLLLAHGANLNAGPESKPSIFTTVCSSDEAMPLKIHSKVNAMVERLVKLMLGYGIALNALDCWGRFPIQVAARYRSKEIVQILLETGTIDWSACAGEEALEWALRNQRYGEEMVRMLLGVIPPLSVTQKGTLLFNATNSYPIFMNFAVDLVHDGADVNIVCGGQSALHKATMQGQTQLVQLLVSHGAEVDPEDIWPSPLAVAASYNHFNITKLLLEHGADVNHSPPCAKGGTALKSAANKGRLDIVHLLLENDNQNDAIDLKCQQAALSAEEGGHTVLARILRDYPSQQTGNR